MKGMKVMVDALMVRAEFGIGISIDDVPKVKAKYQMLPLNRGEWRDVKAEDIDEDTRKSIAIELLEIAKSLCPDAAPLSGPLPADTLCEACEGTGIEPK
jgi:hypothetical protein